MNPINVWGRHFFRNPVLKNIVSYNSFLQGTKFEKKNPNRILFLVVPSLFPTHLSCVTPCNFVVAIWIQFFFEYSVEKKKKRFVTIFFLRTGFCSHSFEWILGAPQELEEGCAYFLWIVHI